MTSLKQEEEMEKRKSFHLEIAFIDRIYLLAEKRQKSKGSKKSIAGFEDSQIVYF